MLDFSTLVVLQGQNTFARPVTITPHGSQPGKPPYDKRGIYVTTPIDVMTEGGVVFSDQQTKLKIRLAEYPVTPEARDYVFIPATGSYPEVGLFEVQDVDVWADGAAMLVLKKVMDESS